MLRYFWIFSIVSLLTCCDNNPGVEEIRINSRDSGCVAKRMQAIKDFQSGDFEIDNYSLPKYGLYAEEILYLKYGIKPKVGMPYWVCGTGLDGNDMYWWGRSYIETIDSLMKANYGPDVYSRTEIAADSLKRLFPTRYDTTMWNAVPYAEGLDSSVAVQVKKYLSKPIRPFNDSGVLWIRLEIDSFGNLDSACVTSPIRTDIDSVAVSTCRRYKEFRPAFRWGHNIAGTYLLSLTLPAIN